MAKLIPGVGEKPKPTKKRKLVIGLAVVLVVLGGLGAYYFFSQGPGSDVFKDPVTRAVDQSSQKARSGDSAGATKQLDAAIQATSDPSQKVELYTQKAVIQSDDGDTAGAVSSSRSAVSVRPSIDTYRNLGQALAADSQNEDAIAAFKKALALYDAQYPRDNGSQTTGHDYYVDQITGLGGSV